MQFDYLSFIEQFGLTAAENLVHVAIKNPTSAKSKTLRRVLVDLKALVDEALSVIPDPEQQTSSEQPAK